MRIVKKINENWKFIKEDVGIKQVMQTNGEVCNLPHTWNNQDGQDGGNDYYRGTCWYQKVLPRPQTQNGDQVYLEFRGVNSTAEVWVNNQKLCIHDGGYSTFRVNITEVLESENEIIVSVDNTSNDYVYPQKADFTFYGGIYRDVYLVTVSESHFDMDYYGGNGVQVRAEINDNVTAVHCKAFIKGMAENVKFEIAGVGYIEVKVVDFIAEGTVFIPKVHLWNGLKDPYLYQLNAELLHAGQRVDYQEISFGCRTFSFDKDRGFLLNGESYPLRGVSRHQDRKGVGNAITKEMMREDMDIIKEIGANTIRLAHYQHDQYFYELCDKEGIVVWAEIPYITKHMPKARANTVSQLSELIVQNYNHPSIICWGLSNEITVNGCTEDLVENHKVLNDLAHELDNSRPTAMAHVFILEIEEPLVMLPDICSYNLYYGWYLGELKDNDVWFDNFRKKYPDRAIGLSEYGADANPVWQTSEPEQSDYTEQYQAVYHEHMLKMFETRPYIWGTHVWNIFDFGADGRDEGGAHGVNQKGLVTFDRKHRKDAFYLYKAYWSDEAFLHICGANYIERHEEETEIKVYSNAKEVELFDNGELIEKQSGEKIFTFHLKLTGKHQIKAKAVGLEEQISIQKVASKKQEYSLPSMSVTNWFERPEMECKEGYYSIKDTMGDIKKSEQGAAVLQKIMSVAKEKRGDVAEGVKTNATMEKMMDALTVEMLIKQSGGALTEDMVVQLNQVLSKIKKIHTN